MLSNRYMPLITKLISSTFAKLIRLKAVWQNNFHCKYKDNKNINKNDHLLAL